MLNRIKFKLKTIYLNLRYRHMQDKPGFTWSSIANMPFRKKELAKLSKRGLIETRQVSDGYTNRASTEYRFNKDSVGKYYARQSMLNAMRDKYIKRYRKYYRGKQYATK